MKYLTIIVFLLLTFNSNSQQEKGIEVRDVFSFGYENAQYSFMRMFKGNGIPYADTFKIAFDSTKHINMWWSYLNEAETMYPRFDTLQWFFNDTILGSENYSHEFNHHYYSASSFLNDAQVGYYQLRNLGKETTFYLTDYPVIHVYKEKAVEDSVILKSSIEYEIYPNPASETITLKVSEPIKNGKMIVHDLKGKLKMTYQLDNENLVSKYDVSRLSSGIYIFSIIDNENGGEIKRMKVVIE